ncbi:hypothetical protein HDU67_002245 [Dinochytrium kinnereticum]|nr:hypothetical protein HDU67_002245 [Dinochytrium kinnereticum]
MHSLLALLLVACLLTLSLPRVLAYGQQDHSNYGDYHQAAKLFRTRWSQQQKQEEGGHAATNTAPPPEGDDMFVFFSLYDYNHDAHLDGSELRIAFAEFEEKVDEARNGPDSEGKYAKDRVTLKEIESLIDHVLEEDDLDNDGMISWEEYLQSQKAHNQS